MEQLSVIDVHGGCMYLGTASVKVRSRSGPKEDADLYIDVRPHGTEARIDISTVAAQPPFPLCLRATADTVHQLAEMLQDTRRVLNGEAPSAKA